MKIYRIGLAFATALLAMGAFAPSPSRATTVTLSADRDNTLIEDALGADSNGIGPAVFAGRTSEGSNSIRRAVVGFDVTAAIPAGAVIDSVELTLTRTGGNSAPSVLALHALLADWGEGTSSFDGGRGAPSTAGDATWIHGFYLATFWTPGGDFSPTATADSFSQAGNVFSWTSTGLQSDVQFWLDNPANNFGWILLGDETVGGTSIKLASREHETVGFRPELTVIYTVPEPHPTLLLAFGLCALAAVRGRS